MPATQTSLRAGPPVLLLFLVAAIAATAAAAEPGFVALFNGRDLTGWDGSPGWWRVEEGAITAESTPEKPCTQHNYLIWRGGELADFELRFEYRIIGGNSGVQFRSRELPDWDMRGYQADLEDGEQWTGALFEHARGGIALRGEKVLVTPDGARRVERFADPAALQQQIHPRDWNDYRIVARGPEMQLFINGVKTADVVDRQTGQAAARGLLGLQMHPGPPMKVQFRNIRLKEFVAAPAPAPDKALADAILADPALAAVLDRARALLATGLTAGSGYGEVWIRDLNTFIELSLEVTPPPVIRDALLTFFKFQQPNGDVPDGYIPKDRAAVGYKYRRSSLAPDLLAHKNTVETDQETSLVQAVRKFVSVTGDRSLLTETVGGRTVLERLELALDYLLAERFDRGYGLLWGATTADWGDVQPEHEWGVELDAHSHRAIDIYDNAMFLIAIDDLLRLLGPDAPSAARWRRVRDDVRRAVRAHLWDPARLKFRPHIYLEGSPFPKDFDEEAIHFHGGTAVAIEAGLLTREEIRVALAAMRTNVRAAGAASIGLTLYPPYPGGFFKNPALGPYSYQNGGDWSWFGGRLVQGLVRQGLVREAWAELKPMIARVQQHGDFYEWWSLDNQPRGSKQYRGSAGVLGKAIELLQAWARDVSAPAPDPAGAASATPAERLTLLPGFKAELLCAPSRETEGSWVSLCADPRGRLYASGQYDEGLFRVTLPPAGASAGATPRIEKLPVDLSGAQGLCWAFDSLYAVVSKNGRTPSGLYRVLDSDGDDRLDKVERLRALEGGGDHGWHGVLPWPDGHSLCVVAGNNTAPPPLAGSRVPPHWSEDQLLPPLPDAGGHMKGVLAPGGVIYRVSPDGSQWEMFAHGFRNPYDAAFSAEGELFTFDADMEWDLGTPWYRPTRICHVTSGAEFGWRNGSGKWPADTPDSLPAVLDIGPGSPTGVAFGRNAKFPAPYRRALFAADWTFGRIYAVHLRPEGSSYRAEKEVFVSGVPLPVVDLVVHPLDGALYFITGGWRIQTGLYRVSWTGSTKDEVVPPAACGLNPLATRRQLEAFHGRRDPAAVDAAWPYLGDPDRFLGFAARVALEWQDPAPWRERALAETNPPTALYALLALVRSSARDACHRAASDPAPEPGLQRRVLNALARFDWSRLEKRERLALLRAYTLCFTRLGAPEQTMRERLRARLEPWFPAGDRALNRELCRLLVYLQSPRVAQAALELAQAAPTQEEQLDYILPLRTLGAGWTPGLRRRYFEWFHRAAGYRGGASFAGFVKMIHADAVAALPEAEKIALQDVLVPPDRSSARAPYAAALAGRTHATDWTVARLLPALARGLEGRDLERGRRMFGAAGCFQCHRFAGEGGATGPDLTQVAGRFSPRELLEAILEPSRAISDLYAKVNITRRNGERLSGRIVYHTHDNSVLVNPDMFNPAETVRISRDDIVSLEPSPVSPMPEGLLALLTEEEILDLLAYLRSGNAAAASASPKVP